MALLLPGAPRPAEVRQGGLDLLDTIRREQIVSLPHEFCGILVRRGRLPSSMVVHQAESEDGQFGLRIEDLADPNQGLHSRHSLGSEG